MTPKQLLIDLEAIDAAFVELHHAIAKVGRDVKEHLTNGDTANALNSIMEFEKFANDKNERAIRTLQLTISNPWIIRYSAKAFDIERMNELLTIAFRTRAHHVVLRQHLVTISILNSGIG